MAKDLPEDGLRMSAELVEVLQDHAKNDKWFKMTLKEYEEYTKKLIDNEISTEDEIVDIVNYGHRIPIWSKIKTVYDYHVLMKLFLQGVLKMSMNHLGPLDSETSTMMKNLQIINEYGFIPTNSQPGKCDGVYSDYAHKNALKKDSKAKGMVYQQQRGYIMGIYRKEDTNALIKSIFKIQPEGVLVSVKDISNSKEYIYIGNNIFNEKDIKVLMDLVNMYGNRYKSDNSLELTSEKVDLEPWDVSHTVHRFFYKSNSTQADLENMLPKEVVDTFKREVYEINLIRLERCIEDLDQILLTALENINEPSDEAEFSMNKKNKVDPIRKNMVKLY